VRGEGTGRDGERKGSPLFCRRCRERLYYIIYIYTRACVCTSVLLRGCLYTACSFFYSAAAGKDELQSPDRQHKPTLRRRRRPRHKRPRDEFAGRDFRVFRPGINNTPLRNPITSLYSYPPFTATPSPPQIRRATADASGPLARSRF